MSLDQERRCLSGNTWGSGFLAQKVQGRHSGDLDRLSQLTTESLHYCNRGDYEAEKASDDIADLLPTDPFGTLHPCNPDCKAEKVSDDDAVDLLPSDPFGMDMSAKVTAISGWIEEFDLRHLGFESVEAGLEDVDDHVIAELNIIWEGSPVFHSDSLKTKSNAGIEVGLHEEHLLLDGDLEEFMSFINGKHVSPHDSCGKHNGGEENNIGIELGPPPDALLFVFGYLGVKDLLSVERVCKSLRDAVQKDPLLWRNIQIDYPLSNKITDDALLRLAERAQGSLHSLSLIRCWNVTDHALKRVLETNTRLTQLNVSGCIRLSIECIISNLKLFKSIGIPGIKCLRIGGICGVTSQNIEELKLLLSNENQKLHDALKPRFFRGGHVYLSFDDDRYIDIESCPRCHHVRQVYDCPADSCRGKWNTPQACRGCTICIPRCMNCGRCLSNCDYEETFCLDYICLDCLKEILNRQERSFCHSTLVVVHRQLATLPSGSCILDTTEDCGI